MTYDEILKEEDLQFPWRLKPLLKCRDNQDYGSQSWSYYAYSYDRAFEIMARHTLEYPINNQSLTIPLFYLARHSMELALEEALREIAHIGVDDARTDGHDLLKLYDDLQKILKDNGVNDDGRWSNHCRRILTHIHSADPKGEHFRYPAALNGNVFPEVTVNIEGLIRAHYHMTLLADCVVTMLQENRNYELPY